MKFQMTSKGLGNRAARQTLLAALLVQAVPCASNCFAQDAQSEGKTAVVVRIAEAIIPASPTTINGNDDRGPASSPAMTGTQAQRPTAQTGVANPPVVTSGRTPQLYKRRNNHISVPSNKVAETKAQDTATAITAIAPEIQVVEAPSFLSAQSESVPLVPELNTQKIAPAITVPQTASSVPIVAEYSPIPAPPILIEQPEQEIRPASVPAVSQYKPTRVLADRINTTNQASLASVETARSASLHDSLDKITIYQRRMTSSTFEKNVVKTVSYDESTCKSFIVDSHNIALLGIRTGQAQIDILFDDGSKTSKLVSVESPIYRGEPVNQNEKIASLTQSLSDMYPNASIELSVVTGGAIAVRGEVKSETDARDILVLVRQMFLVPIQDKLIVRTR